MRRGALHNLEHKSYFCPVLLKEMLEALKQKKVEINRNLKYILQDQETKTIAKNVFTLKNKENPTIQFELKTYE